MIAALQGDTPESRRLLRFLSVGAHPDILEQIRRTLPSAASGAWRYLSLFFSLWGRFPPYRSYRSTMECRFRPGTYCFAFPKPPV